MTYEEIEIRQRVKIMVGTTPAEGTVVDKELMHVGREPYPRVWVETDEGERICVPSVLVQA